MTTRIFDAFGHLVRHNLLLLGILLAIWMSMHHPMPENALPFDVNTPLVALIFVMQGLKISFKGAGHIRRFARIVGGAVLVAVVLYPMVAQAISMIFGLKGDFRIGFMLFSSLPNPLVAAMAMAASAGGDPLTGLILLVALNLVGLVSIPANLALWLGSETPVSEFLVLKDLLLLLFIPAMAGQLLRRFFPRLPKRTETVSHYIPMACIIGLIYTSCSREVALFHSLKLTDLTQIIAPCLLLHLVMLAAAWFAARRWLKMDDRPSRSFLFITADKPMTLSVVLWSVTYAHHHPLAIFPILVGYVGQVVFDSVVVSRLIRNDVADTGRESDT